MNVFKRLLISIILLCTFCFFSFIVLLYSHFGLNVVCYLAHYYIPELEIKKSIGQLNNCTFYDVSCHFFDKKLFIRKLHIKISLNFFKKFYVCVDKIVCKKCDLYLGISRVSSIDKTMPFHFNLASFFSMPIILKHVRFDDFSCFINNMLFFMDHFSGKYCWTGDTLKCLYSKSENIYIKQYKIKNISNSNFKKCNIKSVISSKKFVKEILNYFEKCSINFPINLDIKYFFSNNVYFLNKKYFSLHRLSLHVQTIKNKINIKRLNFFNQSVYVNVFGVIDCNTDFFSKIAITCINFKNYRRNQNIDIVVNRFLFHGLNINCQFYGFINTKICFKFTPKRYGLISNLNSFVLYFNLVNSHEDRLCLEEIIVRIIRTPFNYTFFFSSTVNINKLVSIKLYLSGIGKYLTIFVKNFQYKFLKNKIVSDDLFSSVKKNTSVVPIQLSENNNDICYSKCMIQNIIYQLIHLKEYHNASLDIKILCQNRFNKVDYKSRSVFFKIYQKWIVPIKNKIFNISNISTIDNKRDVYVDIIFECDKLSCLFSNYFGSIRGNIKFSSIDNKLLLRFIGHNLSSSIFKISNLEFLIILDTNSNTLIETIILARGLAILNLNFSHIFLKLHNYEYNCNFRLYALEKFLLFNVNFKKRFNFFSKRWVDIIDNINICTPLFNLNIDKILIMFDDVAIINGFNSLFVAKSSLFKMFVVSTVKKSIRSILGENENNISNLFMELKRSNAFFRSFMLRIIFNSNYSYTSRTLILKFNFEEKINKNVNEIFLGSINIREIHKKFFVFTDFIFKNTSILLLKLLVLDMKSIYSTLHGTLFLKKDLYDLNLLGNVLIKDLHVNSFFHLNKINFDNIYLLFGCNNIQIYTFITIQSFLKFLFKANDFKLLLFTI
ncbi:MAG: hypothetical protein U0T60_00390 [Buchnera aphidicola (Meitanaphis microgallis)]